jgi:hypothetical protein
VITLPPSGAVAQRSPAKGTAPSLSLTATPHELEPPIPDVAEDLLLALVRICGFLTSNTARAWRGEELAATPPLVGRAAYLDPVKEDLERISEMVADKREEGFLVKITVKMGKGVLIVRHRKPRRCDSNHDHTTNSHEARM